MMDEHVKYEWDMLMYTDQYLTTLECGAEKPDQGLWDALHESFWVHAMNLARYYKFIDDVTFIKVNDQILTLTNRRTTEWDEKLKSPDRATFIQNLTRHVAIGDCA